MRAALAGAPGDEAATGEAVARLADDLAAAGEDPALVGGLRAAARAATDGTPLPLADAPRTWSCRGCGRIAVGVVTESCPTCEAPPELAREQLPVWYLEPMSPAAALGGLQAGAEALAAIFGRHGDVALARPPRPGEWSVARDAPAPGRGGGAAHGPRPSDARRGRSVAGGHSGLRSCRHPTRRRSRPSSPASALLRRHREMREATITRLRGLPDADWQRTGRHPEWGTVTVASQAAYFTRHLWSHLAQVRAAVDGRVPGEPRRPA